MVINNAGNVGIGTTSPAQLLDIAVTSGTANIRLCSQFAAGYITSGYNAGVNSYIGFHCGANNTAALGTPQFVVSTTGSGYAGINTSNPASRLHVHNTDSNYPIRLTNDAGGWFIGQPNNAETALYVVRLGSGTFVYVTPGATSWAGSSDRRLKENIVPLSSAVENIMKLNPVKYNFIGNETNTNFGLIAQEVLDIYPEVVSNTSSENYEDGVYGITYTEFVPILIKGMQEQQEMIQSQQAQIDALVARLAAAGIA